MDIVNWTRHSSLHANPPSSPTTLPARLPTPPTSRPSSLTLKLTLSDRARAAERERRNERFFGYCEVWTEFTRLWTQQHTDQEIDAKEKRRRRRAFARLPVKEQRRRHLQRFRERRDARKGMRRFLDRAIGGWRGEKLPDWWSEEWDREWLYPEEDQEREEEEREEGEVEEEVVAWGLKPREVVSPPMSPRTVPILGPEIEFDDEYSDMPIVQDGDVY